MYLASETCALDIIGAKFIREVENGESCCNHRKHGTRKPKTFSKN